MPGAVEWRKSTGVAGGFFEHARVDGRSVMIRLTPNGTWVVRVDGKPVRGSHRTAEAARAAAVRAAGSA